MLGVPRLSLHGPSLCSREWSVVTRKGGVVAFAFCRVKGEGGVCVCGRIESKPPAIHMIRCRGKAACLACCTPLDAPCGSLRPGPLLPPLSPTQPHRSALPAPLCALLACSRTAFSAQHLCPHQHLAVSVGVIALIGSNEMTVMLVLTLG